MALSSRPSHEASQTAPLSVRRGIVGALPALYVGFAAMRAMEDAPSTWLLVALGIAVGFVGGASRSGHEGGTTDRLAFVGWTALSVALATGHLQSAPLWADVLRALAATTALVTAAIALGRMESEPGLSARATEAAAGPAPRVVALVATAIPLVTWGSLALASGLAYARGLGPDPLVRGLSAPLATFGAMGSAAAAFALAGARRHELAAPARALVVAGTMAGGLLVAVGLGLFGPLRAEPALAVGATLAALVARAVAHAPDALAIAQRGRRAATLLIFGAPVVGLASIAGLARAPSDGFVPVAIAAAALAVGVLAKRLEEPLLPAAGALLHALTRAREATRERDTRAAISRVLVHLREAAGHEAPSAELWLLHPVRVCTVDAAGYVREREAELPTSLLDVARDEPELTLRTDVLRALEVRRADLRPLLRWLDDRGALFATLVTDGEDVDGVIVVPAGRRAEPLTLGEVHEARRLADALVATCQTISARERHLARERELRANVEALEDELARVDHVRALDVGRNVLASTRLARPATVGIYAAASRMAYEALERRIGNQAPTVVLARPGVDPVPYVARAHLAGPRKDAPLVIVDGTSSREHDLLRWKDEKSSPLALADRGMLVLVDGAALPRDVQVLVARALGERRTPWERATPLDVAVTLTSVDPPDQLVDEGRLAPELFARFEDARPIELPGLAERAEDLRAIVADRLAREGLRVRGRPVGIDSAAFARLVEHAFPAEDAELAALVTRLVAVAKDDVVRAADLDRAGFAEIAATTEEPARGPRRLG